MALTKDPQKNKKDTANKDQSEFLRKSYEDVWQDRSASACARKASIQPSRTEKPLRAQPLNKNSDWSQKTTTSRKTVQVTTWVLKPRAILIEECAQEWGNPTVGSRSYPALREGQSAGPESAGETTGAERQAAGRCSSAAAAPMSAKAWHEEPISKRHDRDVFDCGEEALNEFLRRYARNSHELGGAKTFLAIDDADNKSIFGFFSLSPATMAYARTAEIIRRGLACHDVPGFRLARLAVDRRWQGRGIGGQLLLAAGRRCVLASAEVGGVMLVIDAKNERVAGWYAGYGAVPLLDAPLTLLLPLATIEAALKKAVKF